MGQLSTHEATLIEKLRSLPPDKAAQVGDFVDFLTRREEDRRTAFAAMSLSEEAFRKIWDTPEDAAYDRL